MDHPSKHFGKEISEKKGGPKGGSPYSSHNGEEKVRRDQVKDRKNHLGSFRSLRNPSLSNKKYELEK